MQLVEWNYDILASALVIRQVCPQFEKTAVTAIEFQNFWGWLAIIEGFYLIFVPNLMSPICLLTLPKKGCQIQYKFKYNPGH